MQKHKMFKEQGIRALEHTLPTNKHW